MSLIAADVNSSRIRLMQGTSPREGRTVALEGHDADLPLALSIEGRYPLLGQPGLSLCRRSPHLSCNDFLPFLGESREWAGPRCRLDAVRALTIAFDHISARAGKHNAAALAVPGYLLDDQRELLQKSAEKARIRVFGTADVALAAALTSHAQQAWEGAALVADVDDHALTWTVVLAREGSAQVVHFEPHLQLGLRTWKERLLGSVADACVLRSRRDPRNSAEAEQTLYDQLDGLLHACRQGKTAEIVIKSPWTLSATLNALDVIGACQGLLKRTLTVFEHALGVAEPDPVQAVILTASAARLPGLVSAVERAVSSFPQQSGEVHVRVLGPDAAAQALLDLASRWHKGTIAPGHLYEAPLLEAHSPMIGPARLQYRGCDHPFRSDTFTIGRDPRCDLVFETAEYPSISAIHCKIVSERGGFVLHDQSRHGTFVNNRQVTGQKALEPGDWICLGPGGPLLRFLGRTLDKRKLMPTA